MVDLWERRRFDHACKQVLKQLVMVQDQFLDDVVISSTDALVHFNLAPLKTRRDIAMLGVVHRTR